MGIAVQARKFYDLRGETVYRLSKIANVRSLAKTTSNEHSPSGEVQYDRLSEPEMADLEDGIKTVRDLASQFRAFSFSETYALHFTRTATLPLASIRPNEPNIFIKPPWR